MQLQPRVPRSTLTSGLYMTFPLPGDSSSRYADHERPIHPPTKAHTPQLFFPTPVRDTPQPPMVCIPLTEQGIQAHPTLGVSGGLWQGTDTCIWQTGKLWVHWMLSGSRDISISDYLLEGRGRGRLICNRWKSRGRCYWLGESLSEFLWVTQGACLGTVMMFCLTLSQWSASARRSMSNRRIHGLAVSARPAPNVRDCSSHSQRSY